MKQFQYIPEEAVYLGNCRHCANYDLEKGMCKKYMMLSKTDQTCRAWTGEKKDVADKKKKQVQQPKGKGWEIGF